ncbi:MAG: hypothetical protein K2L51_06010, partial [Clostridiales bacterium]|nr:hypothetical protein [Clostridiales bacterium]
MQEENVHKPAPSMVTVGVRSAFWTVVAGILLFACFLSFFPYSAMRFYTKLDLKDMALSSAEKYLRWHSDEFDAVREKYPAPFGKYADALYCAANNSLYFMNESVGRGKYASENAKYYARKVDTYASQYLTANTVISLYPRSQQIDRYSLLHTPLAMHPYVYSYVNRLSTARFKSWYILGEDARMRELVNLRATQWDQADWTVDPEDFSLLAQLSAYIDAELDNLGITDLAADKKNSALTWDDAPVLANVFYGKNKPFDLFVYDAADKETDGQRGDGEFTRLYDLVSEFTFANGEKRNNFAEWVDFIRQNMRKHTYGQPEANRTEHLRYTYYLKTLVDFQRSMQNMTAVLYANRAYFDTAYQTQLQRAANFWESAAFVTNVYFTRDGIGSVGGCYIYEWYN